MADAAHDQRDFFVSFNKADRAWAEWIAWILEEAGHSVLFQHWDFKGNFVLEMDRAHKQTRRTIAVLSPDYLTSAFTAPEWAARFAEDARSEHDLLIPVRVRECELSGLLAQIGYLDLIGTSRSQARQSLLDRVAGIRLKPKEEPFFPGGPLPQAARSFKAEPSFPVALNNLPPANPDFVGRKGVLAELRRLLAAGQGPAVLTQAITGLGGIGKTQTARTYAYRHLTDYALIWWLRAETPATLAADYATLAAPLGLDPEAADQAKLTAAIRQKLQSRSRWLLIFDNVEDPTLPRDWLPGTGGGHALITSRRTDWRGLARALSLELMPEDEALRLLTGLPDPQTLAPAELTAARELAAELGFLPLALAQARAYMVESGKSLAGYLRLFRASRPADFAADTPSPDYPASYATTWKISIDAAAAACPAARTLLELLAFLAPDPLPIEALGAGTEALPTELRDERARDNAIAALRRYSLIQAEAGRTTIHRLVQAVARDRSADQLKASAAAAAWLICLALPRPPDAHTNWPLLAALLPHAVAVAGWTEQLDMTLEATAIILNEIGLYLRSRGAWAEAEPLILRAIALDEMSLGPKHPAFAQGLNNLAELYRDAGRYAEAEPLYQRAIATMELAPGAKHVDLAKILNNIGLLLKATGRHSKAEAYFQRAIDIGQKALGRDHPDVATWLNNLAGLYHDTGRHAAAEPLYQRAIAIGEAFLGRDHPHVARGLNNLALLYQSAGRYAAAEPLVQRAIAINERSLGPLHPDLARMLNNLAMIYRATGHYAAAEPLVRRAIVIGETSLGPDHPSLATWLNNLGLLHAAAGRHAAAEPLYQRAIAIGEKSLGPDHPDLAAWLNNLAGLCRDTSRFATAESFYKRANAICEKAFGPDHPNLVAGHNNLAGLYMATGRHAEAEPLYQRAIAIGEKALGPDHPNVALSLNNLALLYQASGRYAEAEPLFRRAIAILEASLPPNHPRIATARKNYALLLASLGHPDPSAAPTD